MEKKIFFFRLKNWQIQKPEPRSFHREAGQGGAEAPEAPRPAVSGRTWHLGRGGQG